MTFLRASLMPGPVVQGLRQVNSTPGLAMFLQMKQDQSGYTTFTLLNSAYSSSVRQTYQVQTAGDLVWMKTQNCCPGLPNFLSIRSLMYCRFWATLSLQKPLAALMKFLASFSICLLKPVPFLPSKSRLPGLERGFQTSWGRGYQSLEAERRRSRQDARNMVLICKQLNRLITELVIAQLRSKYANTEVANYLPFVQLMAGCGWVAQKELLFDTAISLTNQWAEELRKGGKSLRADSRLLKVWLSCLKDSRVSPRINDGWLRKSHRGVSFSVCVSVPFYQKHKSGDLVISALMIVSKVS